MIQGRLFAVLTGDIVDSSGLRKLGQQPVSTLIENTEMRVQKHFHPAIHGRIDVFRGDSWQMVVREPAAAVRIGLYIRALLKAYYELDSRVSIGYGPVEYLPSDNISTGTGLAFTLSGQGLEECQKPIRMNLSFPQPKGSWEEQGLTTIISLIDLLVVRWTPGQSRAVAGALIGLTQAEIADSWQPDPVSQQAISQHLENAGWTHIKKALYFLEETLPVVLIS